MTSEAIDRIKARWVADGVAIGPGNSPEVLAAFEARYRVSLPPAVRDYFAAVDGTGEDSDGECLRFWPLAELMPIGESPEFASWFVFADFLIHSHTYAIRLTPDPDDGGPVAIPDVNLSPRFLSFMAFLEEYLSNRNRGTYFPTPLGF